jgi:DNA-binding transcriptional regulator YdaS (Cro superfamily)
MVFGMEPAASVISKFGGNTKLARILGVHPMWVARWKMKTPYGTGGRIPYKQVPQILAAAKAHGVSLSLEEIWGL